MASEQQYPLALVIKAVDKATGPLREINAKIKSFTDPLQKLSKDAGFPKLLDAFSGVGSAASKVGDEAGKLVTKFAAVATAAGYAGYTILTSAVEAGDKLAEMSKRVGLSVDAYAQLQFAAGQAHVGQDEFNASMGQFTKRMGEMKANTGPLLGFLNKVSPVLAGQLKGAKDNAEAFDLMAKAFALIDDPAKLAALSAETFGKGSLQMGQFLHQGSAAIKEQAAQYAKYAGPQKEFAERSELLKKRMNEVDAAFDGVRAAISVGLFPALTQLAGVLAEFIASNRDSIAAWARDAGKAIEDWVKGGGVDRLIQGFKDFAKTAGEVIDMIGGPKGLAVVFAGLQFAPLIAAVGSLAASFVTLGIALAPLAVASAAFLVPLTLIAGVVGAVALGGAAIYKNWEPLKQFFVDLADAIGKAFDKLGGVSGLVNAVSNPLAYAAGAASSVGSSLFGDYETNHRSAFDPSLVRPPPAAGGVAKVQVDFSNMPKNVRVAPEKNADKYFDFNMGYSNLVQN